MTGVEIRGDFYKKNNLEHGILRIDKNMIARMGDCDHLGSPAYNRYQIILKSGSLEYDLIGDLAIAIAAEAINRSKSEYGAVFAAHGTFAVVDWQALNGDFATKLSYNREMFLLKGEAIKIHLRDPQAYAQIRDLKPEMALVEDSAHLVGQVDAVFMNLVDLSTPSAEEMQAAVKAAAELLQPDGLLVLTTHNPQNKQINSNAYGVEFLHKDEDEPVRAIDNVYSSARGTSVCVDGYYHSMSAIMGYLAAAGMEPVVIETMDAAEKIGSVSMDRFETSSFDPYIAIAARRVITRNSR